MWSGCWLWTVGPLLLSECEVIGRSWKALPYTMIQSLPSMLSGWRVRVCTGRARNRVVSRSSAVFPQMVSDSFSRGSLVAQTNCCISSPGGRSQAVMRVVKLDVEVLGSRGFVGSAVVRPSNPLKRSSVPIQCQFHAVVLCSDRTAHCNCSQPSGHLWNNHVV